MCNYPLAAPANKDYSKMNSTQRVLVCNKELITFATVDDDYSLPNNFFFFLGPLYFQSYAELYFP